MKFSNIRIFSVLLTVFAVIGFSASAQASEPKLIASSGDWSAYTFEENGHKVCYMASKPIKDEGNYTRRGDIFALVTHRMSENTRDVFSYVAGYPYKTNSEVEITIDGQKFVLFSHNDMAWTNTSDEDRKLSQAIRKGSKMVVKGTSSRGTLTTDTFSLKGSGAAHDAINKACPR